MLREAPRALLALTGVFTLGNVSLFLYLRQSRYYALAFALALAFVYLYLHRAAPPGTASSCRSPGSRCSPVTTSPTARGWSAWRWTTWSSSAAASGLLAAGRRVPRDAGGRALSRGGRLLPLRPQGDALRPAQLVARQAAALLVEPPGPERHRVLLAPHAAHRARGGGARGATSGSSAPSSVWCSSASSPRSSRRSRWAGPPSRTSATCPPPFPWPSSSRHGPSGSASGSTAGSHRCAARLALGVAAVLAFTNVANVWTARLHRRPGAGHRPLHAARLAGRARPRRRRPPTPRPPPGSPGTCHREATSSLSRTSRCTR